MVLNIRGTTLTEKVVCVYNTETRTVRCKHKRPQFMKLLILDKITDTMKRELNQTQRGDIRELFRHNTNKTLIWCNVHHTLS